MRRMTSYLERCWMHRIPEGATARRLPQGGRSYAGNLLRAGPGLARVSGHECDRAGKSHFPHPRPIPRAA